MGLDNLERDFNNKPRRAILNVLLSAVAIIAVVSGAAWGIRMVFYPAAQAGRVMERTLDADNVIYNYEWFKRQREDVAAMDVKLRDAEASKTSFEQSAGPRDTWKFDDRTEWNRLNAIVLGLRNQRTDMVAEYNAKAKMANRNIFMTGDLPAQLS